MKEPYQPIVDTAEAVEARKARYLKMTADAQAERLLEARKWVVKRYRQHAASWPDGIGAWYKPEEWTDTGEYLGAVTKSNATDVTETPPDVTETPQPGR